MNRKVVVLGGAGMVGTALCNTLKWKDYEPIAIDNLSRDPGRRVFVNNHYGLDILRHRERVVELMREAVCVINLAADVGGVFYNKANQYSILSANVALQTIPLALAEEAGVENFIQTSSVCVYTPKDSPHRETDEIGDLAPNNWGYSIAKRVGETAALQSRIDRVCVVRPTNAFGSYDYFDGRAHVIPALIKRAYQPGPTLMVKSPADVIRTFVDSGSLAAAFVAVMEKGGDREVYNVGGWSLDIDELATAICRATDSGKEPVYVYDSANTGENFRLVDDKKLQALAPDIQRTDNDLFYLALGETISAYETGANTLRAERHDQGLTVATQLDDLRLACSAYAH